MAQNEVPKLPGLRRLGERKRGKGRIEVGPDKPYFAPVDRFNMLSQVRQGLDEEELRELTDALIITEDGDRRSIKLLQPVTAGLFHRAELEPYLKRINSTWRSTHTIEEMTPLVEGEDYYLVVIAGHRRTVAVRRAAEKIGQDTDLVDMEFHLMLGSQLTFRNAIITQYRENFHKRPESWEDAQAISAILEEGTQAGDYKTFADCARDLGVTEERVSRAHRFQGLPDPVKELVEKDVLQFGRAISLNDLFSVLAYNASHEGLDDETKKDLLARIVANKLYLPDAMKHVDEESARLLQTSFMHHASKVAKLKNHYETQVYVKELIESILNNGQLGFMLETEEQIRKEEKRRERFSDRRVAIECIRAMTAVLQTERIRLVTGETPAFVGSSKIRALLAVYHEGMEAIRNNQDPGVDLIRVGHELVKEIEESGEGDRVDSFTQSMIDAGDEVWPNDNQDALEL